MSMGSLSSCMSTHMSMCMLRPQKLEEGTGSSGSGVTGGCHVYAGTQIQALWKSSQWTLTSEQSLQPDGLRHGLSLCCPSQTQSKLV